MSFFEISTAFVKTYSAKIKDILKQLKEICFIIISYFSMIDFFIILRAIMEYVNHTTHIYYLVCLKNMPITTLL
jgi:hypothetical protein